jgi:uncharacterized protein
MSKDTVMSFSAMLRQALGTRLATDADNFVEMFAQEGVMEFPFAPPGVTARLVGRPAIAAHLQSLSGDIAFDHMSDPIVHRTHSLDIFVLEFMGFGHGLKTGAPYEQTYISVIELRDGHIIRYRDYWNPLVLLKTLGTAPDTQRDATGADHA